MTDVLLVAEQRDGTIRQISNELVTASRSLTTETDDVHLVVIGKNSATLATELALQGVDYLHAVEYEDGFNHDVYVSIITSLCRDINPRVVMMAQSLTGMDYAAAVAAALNIPIVTNATTISNKDSLSVTRKMYDSKVDATIEIDADPVAITIREGEFDPTEDAGTGEVIQHSADLSNDIQKSRVRETSSNGDNGVDITASDCIIAVGRGIKAEEHLDLVRDVCEAIDATIAGSKPVIAHGWLSRERLVGQSGHTVSPKVYVAVGISGAFEHVAGMRGSETIIAINTDESAPIFDVADYGVVGDLFDVLPALASEL